MAEIRLYMFPSGTLRCKVHNIKMNQGLGEPYEIPVPWFLITHPKGNVVIDGGNAVECADRSIGHWGDVVDVYWPVMKEQEGCLNQLRRLNIAPESVRFVLQSHLHLDHTGAVGRLPCHARRATVASISMPSRPTGSPREDTSARISIGPA